MFAGPDIDIASALGGDGAEHVIVRTGRADTSRSREIALAVVAIATILVCAGAFAWKPYFIDGSLRAAIETVVTITALATSTLLVLCLRARPRADGVLLLTAVITVAVTDLVFLVFPGITGRHEVPYGFDARLLVQAVVPIAFAAAAFSSRSATSMAGARRGGATAIGCLAAIGAVEAVDLLLGRHGVGVGIPTGVVDLVDGLEAAILVIAGGGFVTRARSESGWLLGATCLLLAGVRIVAIAIPAPGIDWVSLRDPLRLAAYGMLAWGGAVEWGSLSRHRAQAAVRAERERIARDIHDGLAQDLATILLHVRSMEATYGENHPLTVAARRALAASRGAIEDLSASEAPTTVHALRVVADELQARHGIDVTVTEQRTAGAGDRDDLGPRAREQAVRIAREAIVNAARHGHARHVEVSLATDGNHWALRVCDDGQGLPEEVVEGATGFGMGAMRARAAELGGELVARRHPDRGTIVEVVVPMPMTDERR